MKKMTVLVAALAALFVTTFSSCALKDALDELTGPKNKWCSYDYEYTKGDNSSLLTVWFLYDEGNYKPSKTTINPSEEKKFPFNMTGADHKEGLYILVTAKSEDKGTSIIAKDKYAYMFWAAGENASQNSAVTADNSSTGFTDFPLSSSVWTGICVCAGGIDSMTGVPEFLKSPSYYTELTDMSNFSWKKILSNFLVEGLLKE